MEKTEIVMDYEKKDFRKLYEDLVKSEWFKKTYHDKSLGDCPFNIPELAESEDERIRKAIIHYILYETKGNISEATEHVWVTWLEKQKEQKPVEYPEKGNEYWFGFNEGKGTVLDRPEEYGLCKPVEWSEEDESIRKAILGFLNPDKGGTKYSSYAELVKWSDWLKSLRPSWKPSKEQMTNLLRAEGRLRIKGESVLASKLAELYEQLKKLK